MRTWTRAAGDMKCGGCRQLLRKGHPILLIRFAVVKRAAVRCPLCAGEPAPADLPPVESQNAITPTFGLASGPGALPLDWKAKASADERQPGEDG